MKSIGRFLFVAIASVAITSSAKAADDWVERLGVALLSKQLGIDPELVLGTCRTSRVTVYEYAPVFVLHRSTKRNPTEIMRLRRSGLGWGEIAKRIGMHPGTFNQMRVRGDFETDRFWSSIVRDRCALSDREIARMRSDGVDWPELSAIAFVAREAGVKPDKVRSRWESDKDWSKVRGHFKVGNDFGKSKSAASSKVAPQAGRSKGKSKGKSGKG